jgi:succinate-semialdehyde dehydrogenase/glutarate-semialdehyde dehydrogenase
MEMLQPIRSEAYVGGEWCGAARGRLYPVLDPATGDEVASVPDMDEDDADRSISAAAAAFESWSATSPKIRAAFLHEWSRLILENRDRLAGLVVREQGKPLGQALGEVNYSTTFIEWYAEEGRRVYGDTIRANDTRQRIVVTKEPIGVCAAITPWNYPLAMVTRKIAPALAAGCTVVVKPSESTPLSALALAELADQAAFPKGVLNVVTTNDPARIGVAFTQSDLVRHLSFTGSVEVGEILLRDSARTIKKCTLELGGNAPFIVFGDAVIPAAVDALMTSKFRNSGQTCVCPNRVFVERSVYHDFLSRVLDRVGRLKVGNGFDSEVDIGPLIDRDAVAKVERHIADAVARGGSVRVGGRRYEPAGKIFLPTVITDINPDMDLMREETFGPVIAMMAFDDEDDVVRLANQTPYGLAAYLFTRDYERVIRVSERLQFGIVGVNETAISNEIAPFGGIKSSGLGREGSRYGIEEYLEMKYICYGLSG